MKSILASGLLLAAFVVRGANPSFNDFNANQFSTAGNKVAIKPGALITNLGIASTVAGVLSTNAAGTVVTITNTATASGIATNGYTTNVPPQTIDNKYSPVINLTYGGYSNTVITTSNITVTSSPFTNENLGKNSVLIGNSSILGASNQISSSATAALLVGRAASSNGVNRITGLGSALLIGTQRTGAGTNEITSPQGPAVLIGSSTSGGLNTSSGNASLTTASAVGGTNNNAGTGSLLVGIAGQGGQNTVSGSVNLLLGDAGSGGSGGTNVATGFGLLVGKTDTGGVNELSGSSGMLWGSASTSSTNRNSGSASVLIGTAVRGINISSGAASVLMGTATDSTNSSTGSGSFLCGASTDTNTLTASGSPSWLFAHANRTFGSAAATAINSFFIGGGATNSQSNSFLVTYGPSNGLLVNSNGVGINTNLPKSTLHVNGNVTVEGAQTNNALTASQFVATDANKALTSTLDGGSLTNVSNLSLGVSNYIASIGASIRRTYYFSGVTNSFGIGSNTLTMIDSPVAAAVTNAIAVSANTHFLSRVSTGLVSRVEAGPISLETFIFITGGGGVQTITAHPEMWLWFTNGTMVQIATSGPQLFTEGAEPTIFNTTMNVTTATNLPNNDAHLMLRWYADATANSPTWNFVIGGVYDSHINLDTAGNPGTYVGTFIGDGSQVTNVSHLADIIGGVPTSFGRVYTAIESFEDYVDGVPAAGSITGGFGWDGSAVFTNAVLKSMVFSNLFLDRYIELTNDGFYRRKLAISNNWTQIRVIAQTTVTPNGTASIGNVLFVAGVCSSVGKGYEGLRDGTMTVSNFFGVSEVNTFNTPHQIDYSANSGFPYYEPADNYGKFLTLRTAGNASGATNVSTVFASAGIGTGIPFGVAPLRRGAFVVEFRKTAANNRKCTTAQPEPAKVDFSQDRVLDVEMVGPGTSTTMTGGQTLDLGLAQSDLQTATFISETNGALDSVNFFWHNPTNALQIYSIAVRAFY